MIRYFLDTTFACINNLLRNQWLGPMVSFKIYDEVPRFVSKPRGETNSKSEYLCYTLLFKFMIMASGTVDFATWNRKQNAVVLPEDPEKLYQLESENPVTRLFQFLSETIVTRQSQSFNSIIKFGLMSSLSFPVSQLENGPDSSIWKSFFYVGFHGRSSIFNLIDSDWNFYFPTIYLRGGKRSNKRERPDNERWSESKNSILTTIFHE